MQIKGFDIVGGLRWRLRRLARRWFILSRYRNWRQAIAAVESGLPCSHLYTRDGHTIVHPSKPGLVETALEIWHDRVYSVPGMVLADGSVVIDAGANVGLLTLWISRTSPLSEVHAFEPDEENFACLQRNVSNWGCHRAILHREALGGLARLARFARSSTRSLDGRLLDDECDSSERTCEVVVRGVNELLKSFGERGIALFKIDIEGGEHELFEAVDSCLLGRVGAFAIEYHDNIVPGTLDLIERRLRSTHRLQVVPSAHGYGTVFAVRRQS